jgi:transposase-like protein
MVNNAESEVKWEGFLSRLWQRGLKGELLSLIITDGNTGLHNAIDLGVSSRAQGGKTQNQAHELF